MKPDAWHAWFSVQADWTRPTRRWLYQQAGLTHSRAVLEVGCGTGVIAAEIAENLEAALEQFRSISESLAE
jgi:ubiquinone/menaquinone biosynthesis C-methylase UbiE